MARRQLLLLIMVMVLLAAVPLACAKPAPTPTPAPAPAPASTPTLTPSPTPKAAPALTPVTTTSPTPKPIEELRIALDTLNNEVLLPTIYSVYNKVYQTPMFDYLIGVNAAGELDPKKSIAYKWEQSPDHLTWTFWIRDGLKFHNGDALGPEDVKFTMDQLWTPECTSTYAGVIKERVDKVEVVPPDKVVFRLKQPFVDIEYYLSPRVGTDGMVIPKNYVQRVGRDGFIKNPVGSGPYKFAEQKQGSYIKLEALDSHWRVGVSRFKYITFLKVPEELTRVAKLKAGEADVIGISRGRVKDLTDAGFQIHAKKDSLQLNMNFMRQFWPESPLSKKEVRWAMAYAINRGELLNRLMAGKGRTVGILHSFHTMSISYPGDTEAQKRWPSIPYDPQKAKQLLTEAGYPKGFDLTYYSYSQGQIPELKMLNEAIASYMEAVGIKVRIVELDYAAFRDYWSNKKDPPRGSNQAAVHVHPSGNKPVSSWAGEYQSDGFYSQMKDPKLDALLKEQAKETTLAGFVESDRKIMDYMYQQMGRAPIFKTDELYASNKKVAQWDMGINYVDLNFEYFAK